VILLLVLGGWLYINNINAALSDGISADKGALAKLARAVPKKPSEPFNMLIMGVDKRPGETAVRSDTLILAHVDPPTKRIQLVSIPRDSRVEIPGHDKTKINHAHAYGGPSLVIETVENLSGLKIAYYAEVDFASFAGLVDALGGVEVDVPMRIHDPKANTGSLGTIEAGKQVLSGGQAITLVRSRKYPLGDLQRIQMQQLFLRALADKIASVRSPLELNRVIQAVAKSVSTNLSVGQILRLSGDLRGVGSAGIEAATLPGEPKTIGGGSYIVLDEDGVDDLMGRISRGESIETTASAEMTATVVPSQVSVAVRNGAGIGGVAKDASDRVSAKGFSVGEVGNANQFVYAETLIVYRDGRESEAEAVRAAIGQGKVVPSRGMYSFTGDVLIVVGKDWVPTGTATQ